MSRRTSRSYKYRHGLPAWAAERQSIYAASRRAWAEAHPPQTVEPPIAPPGPLAIAELPE